MKIMLSGKVPKGDELEGYRNWRADYADAICRVLPEAEIIDPDTPVDESDPLMPFGQDCWMQRECDVLLVNASTKLGCGTAQEMVIAKYFGKPVVTVLPRDTHHRRSNAQFRVGLVADWVHPYVHAFSDKIADDLDAAIGWCAEYARNPEAVTVKKLGVIDEAIDYYLRKSGQEAA